MSVPLVLVAASGLAREVLAALADEPAGFEVRGVLDDAPHLQGTAVDGAPVLGDVEAAARLEDATFLVCAGRGASRIALVDRLAGLGVGEDRFATFVHPTSSVARGCVVGAGSILLAHVVLTASVTLGRHVVCMPQVTLTHDDSVDDYATLCAGTALGGAAHVGRAAYVGMNASVKERVRIGPGATLGMGAVLTRDLPAGETWVGAPARRMARTSDPAAGSSTARLTRSPS